LAPGRCWEERLPVESALNPESTRREFCQNFTAKQLQRIFSESSRWFFWQVDDPIPQSRQKFSNVNFVNFCDWCVSQSSWCWSLLCGINMSQLYFRYKTYVRVSCKNKTLWSPESNFLVCSDTSWENCKRFRVQNNNCSATNIRITFPYFYIVISWTLIKQLK
jgi:hypothetical protein